MANPRGDPFRGTLGHLKIDLKSELDFEHFVAKPKGNLNIDLKIDLKATWISHLDFTPGFRTWISDLDFKGNPESKDVYFWDLRM